MDKVRGALRDSLESNTIIAPYLSAGIVLALLYPVLEFFSSAFSLSFFFSVGGIFYILYLLGLICCFAEGYDLVIAAAFVFRVLTYLDKCFRAFSASYPFLLVFYALLAVYFLRGQEIGSIRSALHLGGSNPEFQDVMQPHHTMAVPDDSKSSAFCPNCGNPAEPGGVFCPYCGSRYPQQSVIQKRVIDYHPSQWEQGNTAQYGTLDSICSVVGGFPGLIFAILLTTSIAGFKYLY